MVDERILPFKLENTDEAITPRAGLILAHEFHLSMRLDKLLDELLPAPGSGRGYHPSQFVMPLVLMLEGGGREISDLRALREDRAPRMAAGLDTMPGDCAIGDWLRRMGGGSGAGLRGLLDVNRAILEKAMRKDPRSDFTLDVDATIIEAAKGDGTMAYDGTVGYQPMLGFIAENGMLVHHEFRLGNAPAQSGGERFISACRRSLPAGKRISRLRSDSAFFNKDVTDYCCKEDIQFAIAGDWNKRVEEQFKLRDDEEWTPHYNEASRRRYRVCHGWYGFGEDPYRYRLIFAQRIDEPGEQKDLFEQAGKCHVILTNIPQEEMDDWAVKTFYDDRGQCEQHIGQLKNGFGMAHMPCGRKEANAAWLGIGALAYNLFLMFREQALPAAMGKCCVETVRWRIYQTAARLVRHARGMVLKVAAGVEEAAILMGIRRASGAQWSSA